MFVAKFPCAKRATHRGVHTLQIVVGCEESHFKCSSAHPVRLTFSTDPASSPDAWELVHPQCLVYSHDHQMECEPHQYSTGSVYAAHAQHTWTRITLMLPAKTFSR